MEPVFPGVEELRGREVETRNDEAWRGSLEILWDERATR